jgi:hypothetical protein
MPKVEIDLVAEVLKDHEIDAATIDQIVRQISRAAEKAAAEAAAEREPPEKKQWVILLSDPSGELPPTDLVGWVLQIPENVSPATAPERIIKAAQAYNATRRGRKFPARSIAEACELLSARFLKEEHVAVKTKLPVTALGTDNVLPEDAGTRITLEDLRRR